MPAPGDPHHPSLRVQAAGEMPGGEAGHPCPQSKGTLGVKGNRLLQRHQPTPVAPPSPNPPLFPSPLDWLLQPSWVSHRSGLTLLFLCFLGKGLRRSHSGGTQEMLTDPICGTYLTPQRPSASQTTSPYSQGC